MKTQIFPLILLSVLLFSCTSNDDEPFEELNCQEDNNKVTMTRFIKSEKKSDNVNIAYSYNELNFLSERTRATPLNVFETSFVYDCRNNIVEINTDETANPQRDGSSKFYEYDAENRLTAYRISLQGEFDYNLTYDENVISAQGTIWNDPNASIQLVLNDDGLVTRLIRLSALNLYENIIVTHFEYDVNGNLIMANDYDETGELIYSTSITYDNSVNPYNEQFQSIYIEKFIDLFFHSGHWASDVISREGLIFPYSKNNINLVKDNTCVDCYEEVTTRVINYDDQAYPQKIVHSDWGAPATEIELEYY